MGCRISTQKGGGPAGLGSYILLGFTAREHRRTTTGRDFPIFRVSELGPSPAEVWQIDFPIFRFSDFPISQVPSQEMFRDLENRFFRTSKRRFSETENNDVQWKFDFPNIGKSIFHVNRFSKFCKIDFPWKIDFPVFCKIEFSLGNQF